MASIVVWRTELALGSNPNNALAAQSYTDVSAYVREEAGASLTRGRQDENSDIQPATFTVTFDNSDGRFTPGNPLSPYVDTLDIGTMIRRTAIIDGVPYTRFTGYIDEISIPEWANSPFEKVAVVSASDRMARIGSDRAGTMRAVVDYETLSATPYVYWPITEAEGATYVSAATTTNTEPLILANRGVGAISLGGGVALPSDTPTGARFEATVNDSAVLVGPNSYLQATVRTAVSFGGALRFSLCGWATPDAMWSTGSETAKPFALYGSTLYAAVFIDNSTKTWRGVVGASKASTNATVIGPRAGSGTNRTDFIALVVEPGATLKLYVNNVLYSGPTVSLASGSANTVDVGNPFNGTVSNVALFTSAMSAAQVDRIYRAGAFGTKGMVSSDAMTLLAGYAGIASNDIVASPRGTTTVDNIPTSGRSRAEVLTEVARIEGGTLFADHNGVLQFQTRAYRWGAGSPAYTFPRDDIKDTFAVTYNDQFVVNTATVRRTGGITANAEDATSRTKRGIYARDIEARFGSDNEPPSRARYLVAAYKDPKARLGAFPVHLTTSLAQQALLGLNLGSLVAFTGLSADAPPFGSQWIEGITESQHIDDYTITFTTSPMLPTSQTQYFRVGSSSFSRVGNYAPIAP